jgi:hypothetical protein
MTICDANGNVIFSLDGGAGQQVSGVAYLLSGTYTLCFTAVTKSPGNSLSVTYQLEAALLSDPIGPVPVIPAPIGFSPVSPAPPPVVVAPASPAPPPVVVGTAPIYR